MLRTIRLTTAIVCFQMDATVHNECEANLIHLPSGLEPVLNLPHTHYEQLHPFGANLYCP